MKWQAEKAAELGETEALAAFECAMTSDDTAKEAVDQWCEINPPDAKWVRKAFLDWAQLVSTHGKRKSTIDKNKCVPMTEAEFLKWMKDVKCIPEDEAKIHWQKIPR